MSAAEPSAATLTPATTTNARNFGKIADALVLLVYVTVVLYVVPFHEKWADEAQAWLLACDLSLKTLWFHELRYEGSPGLWHTILWVAQHVFHLGYGSFSYIGAAGGILSAAWLIFFAPFPRLIRWIGAFSYFFLYQYAVVARSYVLFGLFSLIVANRYRDKRHPGWFALSLVPLALLTLHGALLAFGLGVTYAIGFLRHWREHDIGARKSFVCSIAGITLLYLFLLVILFPPKDTEATHNAPLGSSVIASRLVGGLSGALVDNPWLSAVVLIFFLAWCYRRRALSSFLVPVALVTALYVYIGWEHQQGTVFLAMLAALAISWPSETERDNFSASEKLRYRAMVAVLGLTLGYQAIIAGYAIRNDIHLPYTGATDCTRYIAPLVAEHKKIYGYQYGMVAINAYFDHNVFANWRQAYYHHTVTEFQASQVGPQIFAGQPDYVVTIWWEEPDPEGFRAAQLVPLHNLGYTLVHGSDGFLLTKRGYSRRQFYFVYKRDR